MQYGRPVTITVVGAHMDAYLMKCHRLPTPGEYIIAEKFEQSLDGGKGSNQALAAARLGAKVFLVTRLGNDEKGKFAYDYLQSNGVGMSYSTTSDKSPTGFGIAFIDGNGVPMGASELGAIKEFGASHIDIALPAIKKSNMMLVQLEIDIDAALYACKKGKEHGLTVILNPSPADKLVGVPLKHVDILTPNEPEAKLLAGIPPMEDVPEYELARELYRISGLESIILTLGSRGAYIKNRQMELHVPCPRVKAVDTSGAGDCFNASLAFALGNGIPLDKAVEFAVKTASLSVTRPQVWPSYPTLKEVEEYYGSLI